MKLAFALHSLFGALALPEPSTETSHKVSLRTRQSLTFPDGRADVSGIFASLNATLMKFGTNPLPHHEPVAQQQAEYAAERHRHKAMSGVNVPLKDQGFFTHSGSNRTVIAMDDKYYGPVTIGSSDGNAQTFEL